MLKTSPSEWLQCCYNAQRNLRNERMVHMTKSITIGLAWLTLRSSTKRIISMIWSVRNEASYHAETNGDDTSQSLGTVPIVPIQKTGGTKADRQKRMLDKEKKKTK